MRSIFRISVLMLAGGLLAACDGSNDTVAGGGGNAGGGGGAATLQDGFGAAFAAAFDKGNGGDDALPGGVPGPVDTTAEPNAVALGDIDPITFTEDPVDVPNT